MDQNQQKNIYPDLYKNTQPGNGDDKKVAPATLNKKHYCLKGALVGLIIFTPFFFAAFYVWNTLNNFFYPHHGNETSFIRPMVEALQLIVFGLPIFIIGGIIFSLAVKDRIKRFFLIGGIAIAAIFLLGAAVYAINLNLPSTKKALERCERMPDPPVALYSQSDQFYDSNFCELIAKGGSFFCNYGSDKFQIACTKVKVAIKMDPSFCAENKYTNVTADRLEECQKFPISYIDDLGLCKKFVNYKIRTGNLDEICYRSLALEKKDISVCDNLWDIKKDECYAGLAASQKNIEICNQISNQLAKDYCLSLFLKSDDCSFCEQTAFFQEKQTCDSLEKYEVLIKKTPCYKDTEKTEYEENYCIVRQCEACYISSGLKENDTLKCNEIKDKSIREHCYWYLAMGFNDPNLCQKITDSLQKRQCEQTDYSRLLSVGSPVCGASVYLGK